MKKYNLLVALKLTILSFFFVACSNSEKIDNEEPMSPEVVELTRDVDFVDALINTGQMLRRSSTPDKEGIQNNLRAAKDLIAFLDRNPRDVNALKNLENRLLNLRSLNLSERDAPRLESIFQKMNSMFVGMADLAGFAVREDFAFTLFQYDFVRSVAPFGVSTTVGERAWDEPIERIDIYRFTASKGSNGVESWLISPTFDFTNTKNPGLRIRHGFSIRKNSRVDSFDAQLIKNTVFKVYYSEDFVSGLHNGYNVTWKELDIGELPLGVDFHFVDTGYMPYKKFEGKKITIAFGFNASSEHAQKHFLSWDIFRFDVLGSSKDFSYKPYDPTLVKEPMLYEWTVQELKDYALESFTERIIEGRPGNFRIGDFNGEYFVRGSGRDRTGIVDLYTPVYDLAQAKRPYVQALHAANHYNAAAKRENLLRLFVAEDIEGSRLQELEWVDLSLNVNNVGRSYNEVWSDKLVIPDHLKNKKIRLAFRWIGMGEGKAPVWDIHGLKIGEMNE